MKISLKWLSDFVDVAEYFKKPEALADILTKAGLEVEEIQNLAKDFEYVTVGLILEKDKHPNADKLSLCRVTTGEGVVHQIVCGAQNHKANDRVVVALPGAVLPGNFVIKHSAIRGVESGGMLCSEKELGLLKDATKESPGIMILPEEAPIGKSFADYQGLNDVTFELKVTPNRADCLSHYGLAREVACLLGRPLKKIEPAFATSESSTKSEIVLEVRDELCQRYAGRFITGVKVGLSPAWLKKRLEVVGLNSINNIVDVTNYVMMEMGQPLHAFDVNHLAGKKIIVEKSAAEEKFQTLDGTEISLTGEELMIKDGQRSVAMAGVVGGKNSGVSEDTTQVFLESAYFNPMTVRKSGRRHGITTDSGYRFSRGVDPEGTVLAMNRATELILKVAGGVAFGEHHDHYPSPVKKHTIKTTIQIMSDRMGYKAETKIFEDFMQRLGCAIEIQSEGQYEVTPPAFRFDLETEMDLVEEYARLYGYDKIPETVPAFATSPTAQDAGFVMTQKTSKIMRAAGFQQAINMAFVAEKAEKAFIKDFALVTNAGLVVNEQAIRLMNPLSDDLNVMRSTLGYSLFKNMTNNFHQGNQVGRLFEIGKTFNFQGEGLYGESGNLALMAWGLAKSLWNQNQDYPVVFEVKAAVESMLSAFGIKSYQWLAVDKGQIPAFLHRGQCAILQVEGKKLGYIGAIHPVLSDEHKIRVPVAMAEIHLDPLFKGQPRIKRFESLSKFPAVERDLALVMAKATRIADVQTEIKKCAGSSLRDLEIFDQYEGDKLEKGLKSVAFRLIYQDKNATLHDEAVNSSIQAILEALKQKFSITVR